jgi:hypothetical protein
MGNDIQKIEKRLYTLEETEYLTTFYPYIHNHDLAVILGRSATSIVAKAFRIKVHKCKGFYRLNMRRVSAIGRDKVPFRSNFYKKGNVSWNKGKKITDEHRKKLLGSSFKKGNISHNVKPIGATRNINNYNEIKVDHAKWMAVSRYNWMQVHGEIPKDSVIFHIDGNHLNDKLDNLCLITRGQMATINRHYNGLTPELKEVQIILNQIKQLTK